MYPPRSPIHSDTHGCVGAWRQLTDAVGAVDMQRRFRADADARPAVMRCDEAAQADELPSAMRTQLHR
ncbi:hypothetical protein DF018_09700 [Burkholderia cenocepacia]|nr:hypothetical protein DF018_09700 [Burkholderia cenocepacia]